MSSVRKVVSAYSINKVVEYNSKLRVIGYMEESNLEIKSSLKLNIFFLTVMQVGGDWSTIRSCLKSVYEPRSISFVTHVKVLAMMMVSQG